METNDLDRVVKAAKEAGEHERKKLVINFDKHLESYTKEDNAIEVEFGGSVYKIPGEMTAEAFAFILRKGSRMDDAAGVELLRIIIGDEFIEAMSKSKAPFRLVTEKVLSPIMEHYGMTAKHEDGYSGDNSKNVKTPVL